MLQRIHDLERRLEDAIARVEPQLREQLAHDPDPRTRAWRASALAMEQVRAACRERREPAQPHLDLIGAAAPWVGAGLARRSR